MGEQRVADDLFVPEQPPIPCDKRAHSAKLERTRARELAKQSSLLKHPLGARPIPGGVRLRHYRFFSLGILWQQSALRTIQ